MAMSWRKAKAFGAYYSIGQRSSLVCCGTLSLANWRVQ